MTAPVWYSVELDAVRKLHFGEVRIMQKFELRCTLCTTSVAPVALASLNSGLLAFKNGNTQKSDAGFGPRGN